MIEAIKKLITGALVMIASSACGSEVDGTQLQGEDIGTSSSALSPGCTGGYHAAVGNVRLSARAGCNQKFILALHGGAWVSGTAADMDVLAAPMNAAGIVYASLEYTNGAPMSQILAEVASVIASARANAVALGIDASRMGLIGFSAGGQLALEAGLIDGHMRWIGSFSGPTDITALEKSGMVTALAGMGVRVAYDRVPGDHVSFIGALIPRAIANAAAEMGAPSNPPAYGSGVPDSTRFPIHRCVDPVTQNHRYVFAPGQRSAQGHLRGSGVLVRERRHRNRAHLPVARSQVPLRAH